MIPWLKEMREGVNASTYKIASLCGISQSFYYSIENGDRRPSVETAKKIADVLGFPWTRFFEEQEGEGEKHCC